MPVFHQIPRRKRFQTRLFSASVLLVLSLSIILTITFVLQQRQFGRSELLGRGRLLADIMAQEVRLDVFAGNRPNLEAHANRFLQQPSVMSVAIVDSDNHLLVHLLRQKTGGAEQLHDRERLQRLMAEEKAGTSVVRQGDGTLEFFAPIAVEGKPTPEQLLAPEGAASAPPSIAMGYVRLVLATKGGLAGHPTYMATLVLVVVAFLGLGFLIAYLLARRVTRPLAHLYHGMAAIEGDRFDSPVPVESDDEVGALARGFNLMRERLQQRTTERESALEQVRNMNETLEELVRLRTSELEATLEELEMFNYSASHDLRAPLARLSGFCEALRSDCGERLGRDGLIYVDKITAAGAHMAVVVEAMNSLYNVQRHEVRLMEFDLAEMVRAIVRRLQEVEPERCVILRAPESLPVLADARLLRIAMENLVGNAWKFTSARSEAEIELGLTQMGGKPCYFLRDNGAGFDMAYADKLFKPFYRLHHADEFPGTGIGLTIVHRVFERHGGSLWLEGAVDEGTCCYFTLPA